MKNGPPGVGFKFALFLGVFRVLCFSSHHSLLYIEYSDGDICSGVELTS